MNFLGKKQAAAILIVLLVLGVAAWVKSRKEPAPQAAAPASRSIDYKVIGESVEGRKIESFTYAAAPGKGQKHLLFVGGIHGGYEWNSVLLAYEFLDYLEKNQELIPESLSVSVIPNANPDGVFKVSKKVGRFSATDVSKNSKVLASGRFNANGIDLNRNFDCKWKPKSSWQNKTVSAGSKPFSEPESLAIKNFVAENKPDAVIFWHSQSNAVYASECQKGILPETLTIMDAYAKAAGYKAVKSFDGYEISGDAEGWLASIDIPAITVELKTHESIEWPQNLAGIKALFDHFK